MNKILSGEAVVRQALEQALEMLNDNREYIEANERPKYLAIYDKAIADAEKALEQPAPAQPWVGLTYEEAKEIYTCIHGYDASKRIAEAIEAKLKEKNT